MKKRALWGLTALTTAIAVLALASLAGGAAGDNGHGKHGRGRPGGTAQGQAGFHFLVFDAVVNASDRMIITGDGSFNGSQAHGGGTFDHFQAVAGAPVVASGTWKANDVVSFTHSATNHGGVFEGDQLVMHVTFYPIGHPAIRNVTMEVDCNLGPIGFSTGKTEGVIVTFPGGQVFGPTNLGPTTPFTGVTVFTVPIAKQGD